MYELLLSNLFTTLIVGFGIYAYHSYVEYKRQQYYQHLQYRARKIMKAVSKSLLIWISKYHEMKNADNLETIKEILLQMTENNNGKVGDNLQTIKELMQEVTDVTTKNKIHEFDFTAYLKPISDSFTHSSTKTNSPDLGAYINKINDIFGQYKNNANDKSTDHHKQSDDENTDEMSGIKLTI